MRRTVSVLMGAVVAVPLTLTVVTPASAQAESCFPYTDRWRATILDIPGGSAWDINNHGHIVGTSSPRIGSQIPFVWRDGQVTHLDTLSHPNAATAIDDNDDIAGHSWDPAKNSPSVHLWRNDQLIDLGAPGGRSAFAYAIDEGAIVGTVNIDGVMYPASAKRAFLWKDGKATLLPVAAASEAVDVNAGGTVVGTHGLLGGFPSPYQRTERAFVYRDGVVTDLGTLGAGRWSVAKAVNDVGQVLGWSATASHGVGHDAFVWTAATGKVPVEDGVGRANPEDINNHGMMVGTYSCTTTYGEGGPAVWLTPTSGPQPLRLRVPDDIMSPSATALNDRGEIVGVGQRRSDQTAVAILWRPVG